MDIVTRDTAPLLTRERTPEGFLLARAAVTQVGVQKYKRAEIGAPGDPDEMVGVYRTRDTVFNADTQNAFRGRPITMGHPVQSVTPANARRFAVGSTGDSLEEMPDGRLVVTVFIHDKRAIELVESGQDQVSSGYKWTLKEEAGELDGEAYEYMTDSAMGVNHLALVPAGRLGERVRVLDKDPKDPPKAEPNNDGGSAGGKDNSMDAKELEKVIADATKAATEASTKAATEAATAAVIKVLDERKEAEEKAAKDAADAEAAKEAETKRINDAVKERTGIVEAAKAVLTADAWEKVADKENREIMLAVVGDSIPDAKDRTDEYLRAVLDMTVESAKNGRTRHTVLRAGLAGKATDKDMGDAKDEREKAWKEMNDDLTTAWQNPPNHLEAEKGA